MRINCKDCACWSPDPDTDEQYGTCRQSPPTVVDRKYCLWPATAAKDWCADGWNDKDIDGAKAVPRAYEEGYQEGYTQAVRDAREL